MSRQAAYDARQPDLDLARAVAIAREHAHEDDWCKRVVAQHDAGEPLTRWDIGGTMRKAYVHGWVDGVGDGVTHPSELELAAKKLLKDAGFDENGQPMTRGKRSRARNRSSRSLPVGEGWFVDAA